MFPVLQVWMFKSPSRWRRWQETSCHRPATDATVSPAKHPQMRDWSTPEEQSLLRKLAGQRNHSNIENMWAFLDGRKREWHQHHAMGACPWHDRHSQHPRQSDAFCGHHCVRIANAHDRCNTRAGRYVEELNSKACPSQPTSPIEKPVQAAG